ncbi:hypothetical protein [Rhizobium sp. Root1220]|uniref:hypothetical protein n=1 Tax=Rhizobium sp. Root1220 TaxID=1736432 RepID=UPI0006F49C46|nr:hypothetical protein [Rhizobium sp. Root1220]KQV78118.1 hypothetical protein ASC90_27210 [Rhizobium sp. Root1220]
MATVENTGSAESVPETGGTVTDFPIDHTSPRVVLDQAAAQRLEAYDKRQSELRKTLVLVCVIVGVMTLLMALSLTNPQIYLIEPETLKLINQGLNAFIILTIPFLLGILGACARLLISGVRVVQELPLAIGSGLLAAFSWVGIKSGVFISILAPHLEKQGFQPADVVRGPDSFYTMVLVAVFVGMFATNLYLFVNNRVEQLTKAEKAKASAD